MNTVQVNLGKRSYPIVIEPGILDGVGAMIKAGRSCAIPGVSDTTSTRPAGPSSPRYAIITDSTVADLYGERLLASLITVDLPAEIFVFPAGEASKNLSQIGKLTSTLAKAGFDRKGCLIALGGGVTGDITGFLAAIYMRGISFIQVPTTLLAQVDSSVGGKTGVDIAEGKNLVGAFHQPRAVYIDPLVLATLPQAELLNGIAEVIKYSIIRDRDFFLFLRENREAILGLDQEAIAATISRCCAIKADVVARDEEEGGLRRILNFGHTIGHAVEACSNYTLPHGLAVAMGMGAATSLAVAKGLLPPAEATAVEALIQDYGLSLRIPATYEPATMKAFLKRDKKTISGRPFFVLPTAIGEVTITDAVDEAQIDEAIRTAQLREK